MLSKTIADIEVRIGELRSEIAQHPLSLELAILLEALDKLRSIPAASEAMELRTPVRAPESERLTLLEAAERAVEEAGYPLQTRELIIQVPRFGVTVGGSSPMKNLSSILSKRSRRLQSIRWNGGSGWWLKGQPLPRAHAA